MATALLQGRATPEGTAAFAQRMARGPAHFREAGSLHLSTLGIGTYLGRPTALGADPYVAAVSRAVELGVNVIDSAVNYRDQCSERAVGEALRRLIADRIVSRSEVFLSTKGGFIPGDAHHGRDMADTLADALERHLCDRGDIVAGCQCLAPAYLEDQIHRSRENLGVETIDLYYLHNPELHIDHLGRAEALRRITAAFRVLEEQVRKGRLVRYGVATWEGLRRADTDQRQLSLPELLDAARAASGGDMPHFAAIQFPINLAMTEAARTAHCRLEGRSATLLEFAQRRGLLAFGSGTLLQTRLLGHIPAAANAVLGNPPSDALAAIQFSRSVPGMTTALVGMSNLGHVESNTRCLELGLVPDAPIRDLIG